MPRMLFLLAGAVLLLCAGLLAANARESVASAQATTKACTDAARAAAGETQRLFDSHPATRGIQPLTSIDHCTYVRRWDMNGLAFAGIALAGGLGFVGFGLSRRSATA